MAGWSPSGWFLFVLFILVRVVAAAFYPDGGITRGRPWGEERRSRARRPGSLVLGDLLGCVVCRNDVAKKNY
jgi:hypothetical protein